MSYLGKNVKQNTVTLTPQSADPVSPFEGMVYRSDGTVREKGIWEYRDSAWQKLGSGDSAGLNFVDPNSASFEGGIGSWTTTSFRKTIAGSTASLNEISVIGHAMSTNDAVIYRAGSTPIVGLTNGTTYYVINVGVDSIQLAASPNGSVINISTNAGDGYLAPDKPVGVESASTALSLPLDAVTPLNGTRSILLQKNDAVNGESEAFALNINIPVGYQNRTLALEFVKNVLGTNNYASDDYEVYVKDNSGSFVAFVYEEPELRANNDSYQALLLSEQHTSVELLIYVKTNETNLRYVRADDFVLKPSFPINIPNISDWTDYTPSFTGFGTVSDIRFRYQVDGPNVKILGAFTLGTPTGVEAQITLPNGWTTNTYSGVNIVGKYIRDRTTSTHGGAVRTNNGLGYMQFGHTATFGNTSINASSAAIGTDVGNAGDQMYLECEIPIAELSANTTSALAINANLETLAASSSVKTPAATGHYHQLTNNSITLRAGRTYDIESQGVFSASGSAGYSFVRSGLYGANGGDSSAEPARLSTIPTLQVLSATAGDVTQELAPGAIDSIYLRSNRVKVRAISDTTIYAVTFAQMGTATNARISVYFNAYEIPFSQTALLSIGELIEKTVSGNMYATTPSAGIWYSPNTALSIALKAGHEYDLSFTGLATAIASSAATADQINFDIAFATSPTAGTGQIQSFTTHLFSYSGTNISYNFMTPTIRGYKPTQDVTIYIHVQYRGFSGSPTISNIGFRNDGNGQTPILSARRVR